MRQEEALEILKMGFNTFITGPAGSGKTYLLNQYIDYLKSNRVSVAITASTGIAATHLEGRTIHSWSGIAVRRSLTEAELKQLYFNEFTKDRITRARVLIIDEISMLDAQVFTLVDEVCRYVRRNQSPFGGLQVIVCGDFFQLPPVPSEEEPSPEFAFQSPAWVRGDLKVCYLEHQFRQDDPIFLKALNDIRHKNVSDDTISTFQSRFQKSINGFSKPVRLRTHKNDVNAINSFELSKLKTKEHKYLMQSVGDEDLVNMLRKHCLAPEELVLKEGAQVMFVRNNFSIGYVNGTLGSVIGFNEDNDNPIVSLKDGTHIEVDPINWTIEEDGVMRAQITQIPLCLAWAITVHKSQGMTLDCAEIDLSRAFTPGMGYVGFSRVRSLNGMKLMGFNEMSLKVSEEISEYDKEFRAISEQVCDELVNTDNKIKSQLKEKFRIV